MPAPALTTIGTGVPPDFGGSRNSKKSRKGGRKHKRGKRA